MRQPAAGRVRNAPRRIRFRIGVALCALTAGACGSAPAPAAAPDPAAGLRHARSPAGPGRALDSLEVFAYPGGPAVVLLGRPASEVAAVRLSVPLTGAFERVGEARVVERLVRPRMDAAAAEIGAVVRSGVNEQALVFSVIGAASDLDRLIGIARLGVDVVPADPSALDEAAHRVQAEALAESETPGTFVRRQLGAALFPLTPTRGGDAASATALDPQAVLVFWRDFFIPERMRAVVVGPYDGARLARAFSGWPTPDAAAAGSYDDTARSVIGALQVVRPWLGLAWRVPDERSAELMVASRMLADGLQQPPLGGGVAEVWWSGGAAALVLIVPGERGTPLDTLETRARVAVEWLSRLPPQEAARHAAALLDDAQLAARSAEGASTLIGDLFDRTGNPRTAVWLLLALQAVDADAMRGLGDLLQTIQPTVVRLEP